MRLKTLLVAVTLIGCGGGDKPTDSATPTGTGTTPPTDADQDGFTADTDCDDDDATVFPGADEGCNGIDNDCDGSPAPEELDGDSDGLATCEGDCDDGNPAISPNQNEVCNGVDDDCNDLIDGWDGIACEISIRDETPFASPGPYNGGGIAAHDGTVYIEEYPGVSGFNGSVHLFERSGASFTDWITGAIAGTKPAVSATGTLLLVGNWNDGSVYPNELHCIIEEYDPTGQLAQTLLDEVGGGCTWTGHVAQDPTGATTWFTTSADVREVVDGSTSSAVATDPYGFEHITAQSDGTVVVSRANQVGILGTSGFESRWTAPGSTWVTALATTSADHVIVSTDGPWWDPMCFVPPCIGEVVALSPDLTSSVTLAVTPGDGTFGGFSSMAYDRVANELVVYEDGDLYAIPGP